MKNGFREYVESPRMHKRIVRWNDYIQFATTLVSFLGGVLALLNIKFVRWDKNYSLIVMFVLIVFTVGSFIYKKMK